MPGLTDTGKTVWRTLLGLDGGSDNQFLVKDSSLPELNEWKSLTSVLTTVSRYGSIYLADGSATQTVGTTPVKITGFTANGLSNNTTPDHTNDQITIGVTGNYLVLFFCSFSGATNVTWQAHVRVDDVEQGQAGFHRRTGGTDVGSASLGQVFSLTENEVVTVYIEASASSKSFTPEDMQLVVLGI